jgi:hypothetical protein
MLDPEYPIITDVDEHSTTVDAVLDEDPELRFTPLSRPRRTVCIVYLLDGAPAVAIGNPPEDLEPGRAPLAELLADSIEGGCRITLTGRWATVQITDDPDPRDWPDGIAEPRRMLLIDRFEHTEEHPEWGQPWTAATDDEAPDDP